VGFSLQSLTQDISVIKFGLKKIVKK